jgi:hypothetical protein
MSVRIHSCLCCCPELPLQNASILRLKSSLSRTHFKRSLFDGPRQLLSAVMPGISDRNRGAMKAAMLNATTSACAIVGKWRISEIGRKGARVKCWSGELTCRKPRLFYDVECCNVLQLSAAMRRCTHVRPAGGGRTWREIHIHEHQYYRL